MKRRTTNLIVNKTETNDTYHRFPMELHIVHAIKGEEKPLKRENGLAVTGFFFVLTVRMISKLPILPFIQNLNLGRKQHCSDTSSQCS